MKSPAPKVLLSFLLLIFMPGSSVDAICEDEECLAEPVVGDPDRTLPPLPTPRNSKPSIGTRGSGLIQEISCSNPGVSSSLLNVCSAADIAPNIRIKNNGRILVNVHFIEPSGKLVKRWQLRAGQILKVARPSCVDHRWMVQSLCGDCMGVIRVASTQEALIEISNDGIEAKCPTRNQGKWSDTRRWNSNVVAAGLANIPGSNKVLGFSSVKPGSFNRQMPAPIILKKDARITQVEIYDHVTDTFQERDLIGHNMFCAAITLLPDGKLFAQGGGDGDDAKFVSTFDPFTSQWRRHTNTANGHWYGTAIVTNERRILLALGVDKQFGFQNWKPSLNFPEISQGLDFSKTWGNMTGLNLEGKHADKLHWYPVMHLMPDGDILESGTMNNMWKIKTSGSGSISFAGKRNKVRNENQAWGAMTIMFDQGKLLTVGGIENWENDRSPGRFVYKRAIVIDMNNPNKVLTFRTDDMNYARAFMNLVVLPSGDVLAIGGKNNIKQWDDTFSVRPVELWNPLTDKWTLLAGHQAPRNYHAAAILLRDGRVLSSGGGLCKTCDVLDSAGNRLNHPTSEIFSPPYLFDTSGNPRTRPIIVSSPKISRVGAIMKIVVGGPKAGSILRVSVVKQYAITHTITTDARQLRLPILGKARLSATQWTYTVKAHPNIHVMTPGFWFLFVLDFTGTPSIARDLKIS